MRILVVEDDEAARLVFVRWLQSAGYWVDQAASVQEMRDLTRCDRFGAIVLDLQLGVESSVDFIEEIIQQRPNIKVIVLTAHGSVDLVVKAMRKGASGFITKPTSSERLLQEIGRFVRTEIKVDGKSFADIGIIGESPAMRKVFDILNRVKDVDSTVLITGDSGTGKELIARALHSQSPRRSERFEAINCAAVPEALLESEFFGHVKGAFTDARQDRKGLFEVCSDGTLFLDEIGDLSLPLQGKMLRVLQEREVMPLGSQKSIRVNTRIVAATNKRLVDEVKAGSFRSDLYYRLSVVEIALPPLCMRTEDIPLLARSFLKSMCSRFDKEPMSLTSEVLARMSLHPWPGNIRELQNSIERAVVLSTHHELTIDDLFPPKDCDQPGSLVVTDATDADLGDVGALDDERALFEIHYLRQLLLMTKGNVSLAARKSGKFRADLYRLLGKYQINPSTFRRGQQREHRTCSGIQTS